MKFYQAVTEANLVRLRGGSKLDNNALRFNCNCIQLQLQFDANNPLQPNGLLTQIQLGREIHFLVHFPEERIINGPRAGWRIGESIGIPSSGTEVVLLHNFIKIRSKAIKPVTNTRLVGWFQRREALRLNVCTTHIMQQMQKCDQC